MVSSKTARVNARTVKTAAHCSAADVTRKAASLAVAAAVAATPLVVVEEAFARDVQPYAGLTPCKTSKAFEKRQKTEIKALQKASQEVRPGIRPGARPQRDDRKDEDAIRQLRRSRSPLR